MQVGQRSGDIPVFAFHCNYTVFPHGSSDICFAAGFRHPIINNGCSEMSNWSVSNGRDELR